MSAKAGIAKKEIIGLLYELRDLLRSSQLSPVSKNRIRRNFHSLKAVLLALGMDDFAKQVHTFELTLSDASLDIPSVFSFFSKLEARIESSSGLDEANDDFLKQLFPAFNEALRRGEKIFKVIVSVTGDESYRYPRLYLAYSRLEDLCAVLASVPDIIDINEHETPESVTVFCSCPSKDTIKKALSIDLVSYSVFELSDSELGIADDDKLLETLVAPASLFAAFERGWQEYRKFIAQSGQTAEFERFDRLIMSMFRLRTGELFSYAAREAKRLSRELAKPCDVAIIGDDIVIPSWWRSRLDFVFMHLVRNAIVHGIEPLRQRKDSGKNEIGRIELGARQSESELTLWVADDGCGEPAKKDKADLLSGMGLGMQVVKDSVSNLGGSLDIVDKKGEGRLVRMTFTTSF